MPSPWRKAKIAGGLSRLVSNFRSSRGSDSPLVVQTGFPTSLADLIVKNHRSFLKKHPKPQPSHSFASRVSDFISATEQHSDPVPVEIVPVPDETSHLERVFNPSPEVSTAKVVGNGTVGFQAKLILVMIFAVCSKELVFGITASAFVLLLLELVSNRWNPKSNRKPIEEEEEEEEFNGLDVSESIFYTPERSGEDLIMVTLSESLDSDPKTENKKKKKKNWGKNFAKKLRSPTRPKPPNPIPEVVESNQQVVESDDDALSKAGDDNTLSKARDDNEIENATTNKAIETNSGEIVVLETNKSNTGPMVLFVIVLCGLVGGRVVALAMTLSWWYIIKITGALRNKKWFGFSRV